MEATEQYGRLASGYRLPYELSFDCRHAKNRSFIIFDTLPTSRGPTLSWRAGLTPL
jgi:hypothetical protein